MSSISDKTLTSRLNRHLSKASRQHADAMEKLTTGSVFTAEDPRPSERALAERLEHRVRALGAAKRNINDAVSLLQTAESSMSEISNIIQRMKEINVTAASTTVSDQERRFLFVEYEALHDEINRISQTTEFNGIPLLNGASEAVPEEMVFRVGDPHFNPDNPDAGDLNAIRFRGLKAINASTVALGIKSSRELLEDSSENEGIQVGDAEEMMEPEDDDIYATVYDQAINSLATQRAIFGSLQARLDHSQSFVDVYQENIAAAKSRIADVDYAEEVSRMTAAKLTINSATALLAHSNLQSSLATQLVQSLF